MSRPLNTPLLQHLHLCHLVLVFFSQISLVRCSAATSRCPPIRDRQDEGSTPSSWCRVQATDLTRVKATGSSSPRSPSCTQPSDYGFPQGEYEGTDTQESEFAARTRLQITKPRCQFKRNLQHVFQVVRNQFEDLTGVCGDVKTLRYVSAQCRLGRCLSLYTEVPHCIGCVVFMDRSCHACGQCTSVLKLWLFHFSHG